jgi:hypothetical protein
MTAGNKPNSTGNKTAESHRAASPVRQDPRFAGTPAEQWYFRIDGREFGPSSRDQLEHFLTPPRLCTSLEVMCTEREGYWFLIAKEETIEKVLEKVGIRLEPVTEMKPLSATQATAPDPVSWLGGISETVANAVARHSVLILILLAFVSMNGTLFYLTRDTTTREREILSRFKSLLDTALDFKTKQRSAEEWRTFADEAERELRPLINELTRTASVKEPVRQKLLFAGRDHLKKLFQTTDPPLSYSPEAKMVDKYLQLARDQLQHRSASQ